MSSLLAVGLRHAFGGVRALDGVNLTVAGGEVVGIVGPNGCGKTTALDAISGVVRVQAGRVELDGRDVTGAVPTAMARQGVARTFQTTRLLEPLDALTNVLLGLHAGGSWRRGPRRHRALDMLDRVGIPELAHRRVGELSHGQRRRVELARALVGRPSMLILDEPTAGLFPVHAREVLHLLRDIADRGCAILMVEHDMGVVSAVCDRVVLMGAGRVLDAGPTATVLAGRAAAVTRADVGADRLVEASA
ncbi:MAG: ATP-binding cassette domain-containing protein [Candidatus Dormibacteraeota bacterium]|nr:ATP-binding cassette domain-containing protein [Candidatus Dormibacteraeota bacterium]